MDNKEGSVGNIWGHLMTFASVGGMLICALDVGLLAMRYAACGARTVGCMISPV